MIKQAYEVVVHILNSATNHVRVFVGMATAEKQAIEHKSGRSRSKSDVMSSPPPPLEPALPGSSPGHRMITVASGDNLVNLQLPCEYQFGYDWVQSECGNVLHVNANYCPDNKRRGDESERPILSRSKKIWDRVRSCSTQARADNTPFKSTKQKLLQRECQLVIHLPTETFAFLESQKRVRVEKITTDRGQLRLHGKQQNGETSSVVLTADLSKFQPLLQLSKTAPPERKPPRVSIAHAVGMTLSSCKTLNFGASKDQVAPRTDVRGIWKETRDNPKFALFSWTKAIP